MSYPPPQPYPPHQPPGWGQPPVPPPQQQPQPPQFPPPYQYPSPPYDQPPPGQPQPGQQQPGQPRREHRARRGFRLEPMMLVAVLTLAIGLVLGWFAGRYSEQGQTLDPKKVATDVSTVLRNDYGVPNVSGMTCPGTMKVVKNATYTCTFSTGSAKGSVDIIVRNDAGQYEVEGPRG